MKNVQTYTGCRRYCWRCLARTWHRFLGYDYECQCCGLTH